MEKVEFYPEFIPTFTKILYHNDMTSFDALVYGTIWWYEKMKDGKCRASNASIMRIVGSKNPRSISNSINKLEKEGFIRTFYKDSEKRNRTHILTNSNSVVNVFNDIDVNTMTRDALVDENDTLNNENDTPAGEQNYNINNNSNNNINNNNNDVVDDVSGSDTVTPVGDISHALGNTPTKRVLALYGMFWIKEFGTSYKVDNWVKLSSIIKSLLKRYSEVQIAGLIACMFNWYGATGKSEKDNEFMRNAFYPIGMISSQANKFEVYIRNVEGINFDDVNAVKAYTNRLLR